VSFRPHRDHAIVIGASIGGLCVAEILSRHFARVTLVEKDVLPSSPDVLRRGVPQAAHPHGILARGRKELDDLFPGLLRTLLERGALAFDGSYDMARFTPEGWAPRHRGVPAHAFACTRPLLELTMRNILLARRHNVRLIEDTRVLEPIHERREDGVWITGVRTDAKDEGTRELRGDFVIDASGRGTKAWKWLSELGLDKPIERRVDAKVNYATRHYQAPAEATSWWWRCLMIDNNPPAFSRAGAILAVEDGKWLVTASGFNGDYAPTDEAGWLSWMKHLRSPVLYEVLQRARPLSDIVQNRTTVNLWRQMHRWNAPLHGMLLYGDAICTFNPAYGQGMTSSALAAQLLGAELTRHSGPIDQRFLRRFYTQQAGYLEEGWVYSTTLDLRWPNAEGKRPIYYEPLRVLSTLIERVAINDPEMLTTLIPLVDFGAKKWVMLKPGFLARGLSGVVKRYTARPTLPGPLEIDLYAPPEQPLELTSWARELRTSSAA
jgi:2-polyprenyl-6-methoxyphenol hydroxylase-like FAD-dependent oxidoreductase